MCLIILCYLWWMILFNTGHISTQKRAVVVITCYVAVGIYILGNMLLQEKLEFFSNTNGTNKIF